MSNDVKKNNINGPDAITKIYNTDLGTGKIPTILLPVFS
jgi:hypothetical protein